MNKERIGNFLRELRLSKKSENGKPWSQKNLINEFDKVYDLEVSEKAVSDWELGKCLPEIDKLSYLAELYNVTIDEILDGERYVEKDYKREYVLANENWGSLFNEKGHLYNIRQKEIIKINKRFKELLIKKVNKDITKSEILEFKFLFEHFYMLSQHGYKNSKTEVNDEYVKLIEEINNKLLKFKDSKLEEKLFEVSKLIVPTNEVNIKLTELIDDMIPTNSNIGKRFKMLEWWEKDMLLMTIQKGELLKYDPSEHGSYNLKRDEDLHGKPFNKDERIKEAIKYMIDNGACINSQFLNIIIKKKEKLRIIDELERLYLLCKKPLECPYEDENNVEYVKYYENTRKNRYIVNNRYLNSSLNFLNLNDEELYEFIWKYDPNNLPHELIIKLSNCFKIDTTREFKYILADFKSRSSFRLSPWIEYRKKEDEIEVGTKKLKRLEKLLYSGDIYYTNIKDEYIGGDDFESMMNYFEYLKSLISLDELKNKRDKKKTKELRENIDSYTLEDIRNIYLKEEVREDVSTNE